MKYVIVTLPYSHTSAGIIVLYELQKWLIRYGKDAMVLNCGVPYQVEDDDIVVYAEAIAGNPLKARRVVRFILNEPGAMGGDRAYDKGEILVAYDTLLARHSNGVVLRVPFVEGFFSNLGQERTVDCLWVGKGRDEHHPVTKDCVQITYEWPPTRRELAALLNRTRTLYTYDERSNLAGMEAQLCGCDVKLIRGSEILDYPPPTFDDLEGFKRQLEQFIELTWRPFDPPGPTDDRSSPKNATSIATALLHQLEYFAWSSWVLLCKPAAVCGLPVRAKVRAKARRLVGAWQRKRRGRDGTGPCS